MIDEIDRLGGRHIDSGEYPAVIRTMVTIMKQSDVPASAHGLQEFQQCAFAFRKLESIQSLIGDAAVHVAADHVSYVQLRGLVVGHISDAVTRVLERRDDCIAFVAAARKTEANENLRALPGS